MRTRKRVGTFLIPCVRASVWGGGCVWVYKKHTHVKCCQLLSVSIWMRCSSSCQHAPLHCKNLLLLSTKPNSTKLTPPPPQHIRPPHLAPYSLVEPDINTHVLGAHCLLSKLPDLCDSLGSLFLKVGLVQTLVQVDGVLPRHGILAAALPVHHLCSEEHVGMCNKAADTMAQAGDHTALQKRCAVRHDSHELLMHTPNKTDNVITLMICLLIGRLESNNAIGGQGVQKYKKLSQHGQHLLSCW